MPMTRIPLASSSSSEYRCIISQKWRCRITPEMEARAEAMGRRARDEDGAAAVVRTVEAFLREKVATGEWRDDFQERAVAAYET